MIVYGRIVLFFISLLGLCFVSGIVWLILCCYYELDRWVCRSVIGVCGRVCTYCSLLNVCERERVKESGIGCVVQWLGVGLPMRISPLPVFIIVPVCSGVPLPLHPFIQMEEKERERTGGGGGGEGGGRGPFSLRGEKNTNEKRYFWKKDIFLLCGVSKKSVNFLS